MSKKYARNWRLRWSGYWLERGLDTYLRNGLPKLKPLKTIVLTMTRRRASSRGATNDNRQG